MRLGRRQFTRPGRLLPLTPALVLALLVLLPLSAAAHAPAHARPSSVTSFPTTPSARMPVSAAPVDAIAGNSVTGARAKMNVQLTLGEASAATVEVLSGKRTGYLFNSSGKQIATRSVTFKATDAYTAGRRLRKGANTYHLLSWGPLGGYWVRQSPAIRIVTPTSWKVLVLVYRQTSLDYVSATGELRHVEATMSAEMEALVLKTVSTTPALVNGWSAGMAAQTQTVVYPARPLASVSPLGSGAYWAGPWDVAADLAQYAPTGSYDSVVVLWQPWDADDYVPSWGWGLGLTPGSYSNGAAYATITVPPQDRKWWVTNLPFPGEVYMHEWLHGVIDYHTAHGAQIPALHGTSDYGYSDEGGSWMRWYSDLMQRHVPNPNGGAAVGIGYRIWNSGTPSLLP